MAAPQPFDPAIRRARPDEAEVLTDLVLRSKAHWGYDRAFMERARAVLTVTPAIIAAGALSVLNADGRPAGLYALALDDDGTAELDLFFVDPADIGRGHGARLFAHARAAARDAGAHRLVVESDPNAVGFYERMGMERTGERASPVEAGRTLPLLALDLA